MGAKPAATNATAISSYFMSMEFEIPENSWCALAGD